MHLLLATGEAWLKGHKDSHILILCRVNMGQDKEVKLRERGGKEGEREVQARHGMLACTSDRHGGPACAGQAWNASMHSQAWNARVHSGAWSVSAH